MPYPKKVGTLPIKGTDEEKRTNEIKIAAPLLDSIEIQGKVITADALLTQRKFAEYLVEERQAHYHFTAKGNQPNLLEALKYHFIERSAPDFIDHGSGEHGRIETRKIWRTDELNDYLEFPHVGQAFLIERKVIDKKTKKVSHDVAYGITSQSLEEADAETILKINREHWVIEDSCHYILDWNYDEDRCQIRTGYGPENVSRLRRFAIGLIKSKHKTHKSGVAQQMRRLVQKVRLVFDYLKMTKNSHGPQ